MRTLNLNPTPISILKSWAFVLIVMTLLSCQNEDNSPVVDTDINAERYQLMDVMIVNDENGIPRKSLNIDLLKDELFLFEDGTYSFARNAYGISSGEWKKANNSLLLTSVDAIQFEFTIDHEDDDILELSQIKPADANFAGTTVYYSYRKVKN